MMDGSPGAGVLVLAPVPIHAITPRGPDKGHCRGLGRARMSLSAKLCPSLFARALQLTQPNCDSMHQELRHYRDSLKTYITSTYHVSNPALVDMRAELLERDIAIAQEPYVESTARYKGTRRFRDLELPPGVSELMDELGEEGLVFDPPYDHQAQALQLALNHPYRDLVVTTGTGSGKTETFLLPILGRLAQEASAGGSFGTRAVRALLLYPMNALVNDQLGRLRLLFGQRSVSGWFHERAGAAHEVRPLHRADPLPGPPPREDGQAPEPFAEPELLQATRREGLGATPRPGL